MAQQLTIEYLDKKFDDFGKVVDKKFDDFAAVMAQGFAAVDKRFDEVDKRFEGVDKRFDRLEREFINLKFGQKDIVERVSRLEDSHERTFKRIDEFLILVGRHESEIAALRGGQQRIEERLG